MYCTIFELQVTERMKAVYEKGININNNSSSNACCCSKKRDWCIPISVSSLTTIKEFVFNNTAMEPRNLEPIYPLPSPVVYRIYLDDGHCHVC